MTATAKAQPALVVQLSTRTQAVVTKTGAYLLRDGRNFWLDTRELRHLVEAVERG